MSALIERSPSAGTRAPVAEAPHAGKQPLRSMSALDAEEETRNLRVMTCSAAVDLYLGELTRNGRAATTLHRYKTYLHELADMYPHGDVETLTPEMWRKWLDRICVGANGKSLDVDTISQRVAIAKRFTFWLADEGLIPRDPLHRIKPPKRKNPVENDKVVWVTPEETLRMIEVARRDIATARQPEDKYRKLLCLSILGYTGARRAAVSDLRIGDYDALAEPYPLMTFRQEKGGKFIKKPVPRPLADIIREADLAGVWHEPTDYLIPPRVLPGNRKGHQPSKEKRDARIVYSLVKEVARDAGVIAHVHAIRAAFACFFLEQNPDQLTALKNLMGHANVTTTEIYLRRLDRRKGMEVVVDLDWSAARGGSPSKSAPAASLTTPEGAGD